MSRTTFAVALVKLLLPSVMGLAEPIAVWDFDEAGQVLEDASGHGLHGFLGMTPDPDSHDPSRIGRA